MILRGKGSSGSFCLALAGLAALACKGRINKPPVAEEPHVFCDLDAARREMPQLERECDQGNARSCFNLGTEIHGRPWCGPATPKPQRIHAWGLFEKACLGGFDDACDDLFYRTFPLQSYPATTTELEAACQQGVGFACYQRADQLNREWIDLITSGVDSRIDQINPLPVELTSTLIAGESNPLLASC
ncbi:MAG TPA: hypothetical protein VL137_08400, partial [Polyangiaceae bacterium]|nr:hypothetical protein [Polyangiaceae bacterium]